MRRNVAVIVVAAVAFVAHWGAPANGQWFPGRTSHYRFVPERSILDVSGGIAGISERYHVRGTFDLTIAPSPLAIWPPIYTADFENVDAYYGFRMNAEPVPIDVALGLSDAGGATVYRGPSNVFHFRSENADGSDVKLVGIVLGPWFYLRGETTPPPGNADFFEYRFRGLARTRPLADFNEDGVVDGRDLVEWRNNPLRNGGDFLDWQQQLGETPPTEASLELALQAALASGGAAAVPEPGSAALIAAGGLALAALRRRAISQ